MISDRQNIFISKNIENIELCRINDGIVNS